MNIFDRIKLLANKQGKSINDVELEMGYSKNTLYRLKKTNPSAETLQRLADHFSVSADYLLGRTDNPEMKSYNNDTHEAVAKLIFGSSKTYTEIMEKLPNLDENELQVVNSMIKSLIDLKQKKS